MSAAITRQELLARVRAERERWEELIGEVGSERMEVPGLAGAWTMKDTIAHLTTWWRREVARLAAAQRGERPPDHPPQSEVAIINQWIQLTNRDRPLADVLHDAQAAWDQLEALLGALPEEWLAEPGRFAWMEGRALGAGIVDDFVGHLHEEHEPLIRDWLERQGAR